MRFAGRVWLAMVISVILLGCQAEKGCADSVSRDVAHSQMRLENIPLAHSSLGSIKYVSAANNDAKKKFMAMYEEVTSKTTYNSTVAKWGEGTKKSMKVSERYYLWKRGTVGVYISFSADGKISSKNLYFGKAADLAKFCKPIDDKMVDKVKAGMSYSEVCKALGGDGVETAMQYKKDSKFHRHVYWANTSGAYIQCVFDEKGKLVTVARYNIGKR